MADHERPGRPTKLTDDLREEIAGALRLGLYPDQAAEAAGVSKSTFYAWQERGRAEIERAVAAMDPDDEDAEPDFETAEEPYVEFLDATQKALAYAERAALTTLQGGANGWQAQAWVLERRWRERWGRTTKTEISGPDGGAIQMENHQPEELLAILDRITGGYSERDEA